MTRTVQKVYLGLQFFLVYFKATQSNFLECENQNPDCSCMRFPDSTIQFKCPLEIGEMNIYIIISEKYITVQCVDMLTFNTTILPMLDIKEMKTLEINMCPLSSTSFAKVLTRLNLKNIEALEFHFLDFTNDSLGKDYFIGFESLKSLRLTFNKMINIEEDLFKYMPNLEKLYIKQNKLMIKTRLFDFTPKLTELEISFNSLTSLPDELFKNMPHLNILNIEMNKIEVLKTGTFGLFKNNIKLERLYLSNNNIKELQENDFYGLGNLSYLQISNNTIKTIHENVFKNTPRLLEVNLNNNKIKYIGSKLFKDNNLFRIQLSNNPKIKFADFAFANMTSLTYIDLFMCEIDELPNNLFTGSTNLKIIRLDKNNLKTLPTTLFKDLKKLRELHLNSNKIETIFNESLTNLKSLEFLDLQENFLHEINDRMFRNLMNLEDLRLNKNNIEVISFRFPYGNTLRRLNLSHNSITVEAMNFFYNLPKLESLDLSHNHLEYFDYLGISRYQNFKLLDLSYNNITYLKMNELLLFFIQNLQVDLSNNQITAISYDGCVDSYARSNNPWLYDSTILVNLVNNPIKCDCYAYNLVKYFHNLLDPSIKKIRIENNHLYCDGPKQLKGRQVSNLSLEELLCPFQDFGVSCSDNCSCYYRLHTDAIVANCSDRNLTVIPEFSFNKCVGINVINCKKNTCFNKSTLQAVHLENNALESLPTEYDYHYSRISLLNLTNNKIKNILRIPQNISHLYLGSNLIEKLDYSLLKFLNSSKKLEKMTLDNNPWDCNCSAWNFTLFLRYNHKKVNMDGVNCAANNLPLLEILNKEDLLCPTNTLSILVSCLIAIGTLLIVSIILALYFKFNEEIKIWLYVHNLCLCWVTEAELDKDKIYDAFVSYSHEDEDFLSENLVPVLESNGYKLCLHERDFIPGLTILEQISNAVRDSRRTVIVLSNNFLQSEWAKHEFQAAQLQALKDGLPRIIIILYGDIDVELLDEDFRSYLKTNTYVKWGNKNFWDKLKYALPHSNKQVSRKHADIDPSVELLRLNSCQQEDS